MKIVIGTIIVSIFLVTLTTAQENMWMKKDLKRSEHNEIQSCCRYRRRCWDRKGGKIFFVRNRSQFTGPISCTKQLGVTFGLNYLYFFNKDGGDGLSLFPGSGHKFLYYFQALPGGSAR